MRRAGHRWWIALMSVGLMAGAGPLRAADAPAGDRTLPDMLPQGTLLYLGWPGIDTLAGASKDTNLAKMLAEPEVMRFRETLCQVVVPALEGMLHKEIGRTKVYPVVKDLLASMWKYPTAIGVVGVAVADQGPPQVDAAVIIRAGDQAGEVAGQVEKLLALAGLPGESATEVDVGGAKLKQLEMLGPTMPLRWGVMGGSFVISIGTKVSEHLAAAAPAGGLTHSERFAAAMKVTGGSASTPTLFVDLKGIIETARKFQPMLAGSGIPVLSEEDGVKKLADRWGLGKVQSASIAMVPQAGGFKTTLFIHAPGLGEGSAQYRPLTDDDLKAIPRDVSWASVGRWDLAGTYRGILGALETLWPDGHEQAREIIDGIEERIGLKIEKEVLGAFGDTWAMYDAPSHGGLWLLGMTLVVNVPEGQRLDEVLEKVVAGAAGMVGLSAENALGQDKYRGQTIRFLNVAGVPMPVAVAWVQYEGRLIAGFFPQMVRLELDHLMDKAPSLVENPDFKRGRALMPDNSYAISYVDTAAGVRQMYSFALPIGQVLMAMGQAEGIPANVSMLPSLSAVSRHLFGNVSASARTADGIVSATHGALPVAIPALGEAGTVLPVMAVVALHYLPSQRTMSKRTVSMANLHSIGVAMHMYARENENKFPPDLNTLVESGAISPRQLISPSDEAGDEVSYIYIEGQTAEMDPRNVLAYEKPEDFDGEGTNVLFVDSHVEFMTMPAFEDALEKTGERLGRKLEVGVSAPASEPAAPDRRPPPTGRQAVGTRTPSPPSDTDADDDTKKDLARMLVQPGGVLATQLELFRKHVGAYPAELKELMEEPEKESAAEKWRGPYLKEKAFLDDPWGKPLKYRSPGEHNPGKYDLWSAGPDGEDGTDDDIGNWKK